MLRSAVLFGWGFMSSEQVAFTKRRRALPSAANSGSLWVGVALIGMLALYWTGLASLFDAWSRPEYSHGYLIIPIAIYLFLAQLRHDSTDLAPTVPERALGVVTVLVALLIGLLGNLVHIPDISSYGFILCTAGLVLIVMGARRGLRYWVPLFYLVFMLPLPNFFYWSLSIKLQTISSQIGVAFIKLFGVSVFLDGNIIDLGVYQLQVAEACSGLRYLFPLMSFSFLFAVLYRGPRWHKVVLFLSALPITVLMNSVRIGIIGLLVNRYGTEQAEGFLHFFEGWIIFAACVVLLYIEAILLQRLTMAPRPIHSMLDVEFGSLATQLGRIRDIDATPALVYSTLAIVLTGLVWQLAPARAAIVTQREPLVLFPLQLEQWTGKRQTLEESIERVLAADDYHIANYAGADARAPVGLFVAYYNSQTSGSGIHSPEVCIPAGGWEVSRWTTANTGIRTPSGQSLTVNRAIIQKGLSRQVVYYWFEQRGRHMTSAYAAKAYTVLDSVMRGRTDGALVRVTTPVAASESLDAAEERLRTFLKPVLAKLPKYVPQ